MTEVYGDEHTYKFLQVRAANVNDKGTRYNPCNRPKYAEVLGRGRTILEDYLADQRMEQGLNEIKKKQGEDVAKSKEKFVLDTRLRRELDAGPLLQ